MSTKIPSGGWQGETASGEAEEEAFGNEVSYEHHERKDTEETEKGMEVRSMASDRETDLVEETSEAQIEVPSFQMDTAVVMAEGAKTRVEGDEPG